ncbi:hypothetical protein MKX67_06775 [Cytobacillus sp. FSL W7-1323]|uniref:hypothetical protein n=1 Tax=Cytobacillus TaxID=2675230 RepID=UPI0012FDC2FC|nr:MULTISPECIES: hypothetical protein [Cytobacillus]MEA1854392.1 hypothetical protein [Cytobacillus sp. OWB-43]MED1606989.1 hypothetical protein [Cytobacillus kochii]
MLTTAEQLLFLRDLYYLKKLLQKTPKHQRKTKDQIAEQILLIESVVQFKIKS